MSKFKPGERALLIADPTVYATDALKMIASECRIIAIGATSEAAERTHRVHGGQVYEISVPGVSQWYKPFAHESALRKLSPSIVHPANISIDDLMRTIKTPETVT